MQKINYPLIVSDFDGTLVNADGTITEKNRRAIAKYVAAGGKFAISTGRLPSGILSRAQELGLTGMVSCCQGAIVMDIQSKEVAQSGTLSLESTVAACKALESLDLHIHAYDLWSYYCNRDDEYLHLYEKLTGTKATLVREKPLSAYLEERGLCVYKLLAMAEPAECATILEKLKNASLSGVALTRSAEFLVEVVNPYYSKGTAVQFLADYYGVPVERTVAVGDQHNDMPMIERAGVGVAVGNADELLKARADYVCPMRNEESAIAHVIEKFGFYEED